MLFLAVRSTLSLVLSMSTVYLGSLWTRALDTKKYKCLELVYYRYKLLTLFLFLSIIEIINLRE